MLARLQPKEEVLLLGWGVPMPLPVKSRRYDERFWEELMKDAPMRTVGTPPSGGAKGKGGGTGVREDDLLKELGF